MKLSCAPGMQRWISLLFIVAGALLFLSFGYTEMAGSDLWWHIAAGRELLETGNLRMVDDWSYSAHGKDWLSNEWISDLVYYGWVSLFGLAELVYWKWLVIVATFVTLLVTLSRESGILSAYLWVALAAAIAAPFLDIRPHIYSLFAYALLLYLYLGHHKVGLWVLAPIFLVWVNLHGGYIFGLMVLGILLFPWRDPSVATIRHAVLVCIACALIVLINPYGIHVYLYPLEYALDSSSPFRQLAEWLPPSDPGGIRSPLFFYFQWMPLVAILYCLPSIRRQTGVPFEGIALTVLTLAMALTSRRFIPLYAMSLAVLMAPLTGILLQRLRDTRVVMAMGILALGFSLYRMAPLPLRAAPAYHYLTAEYSYPVDLVNFIQENKLQGKVFAYYNWGGYLHWRTDGDLKVYIDGRANTLYDAPTYNNYVDILFSQENWLEALEKTQPDYILWPEERALGSEKRAALLATGRWQMVYRDSIGWMLARRNLSLPQEFQSSPDSPWRDIRDGLLAAEAGDFPTATRYANQAWSEMPWYRDACRLLAALYVNQGEESEAQAVLDECIRQFPSRQFR